jgi:hypothetical protein
MSTMPNVLGHRVSPPALSLALLMGSGVWFAGAWACYATTAFQNDWSATPLFWMLMLMVTPAICFAIGMMVLDTRKHSRLSRLGWCALVAAFFPVTLGTWLAVWAVKELLLMSDVRV